MIEYYSPHKKFWLKSIAVLLVISFVWYDIAWAGDLFYMAPRPISASEVKKIGGDMGGEKEVTNYDLISYDKKQSIASKLLPSNKEREQSNAFAPAYVQEQQRKHEDIIGVKQDAEDLSWLLRNPRKRQDEEIDLKKRKSGGEDEGGQGVPVKYTLDDFDEEGQPGELNVYEYNPDGSLKRVVTYDIREKDVSVWMKDAKEIKTKKDGEFLFGSYDKEADLTGLTEDDILNAIYYKGGRGEEAIDYVLSDYYEGKPSQITIYDYDKTGDGNLDETRTYNIDDLTGEDFTPSNKSKWSSFLTEDRLDETNVYEGAKGEEHIKYSLFDYAVEKQADGSDRNVPHERRDYEYDGDGKLINTYNYDISDAMTDAERVSNKDNKLEQTIFEGQKGNENPSQTLYFDEEGKITQRKDYEYREYDAKYFYKGKRRVLADIKTYDTEGLSAEEAKIRGAGELFDESTFMGGAGHEKIDQYFAYDENGNITDRTDYIYEKGRLVSTFSFDTSDVEGGNSVRRRKLTDLDGNGKIDAEDATLAGNGEFTETSFTGRAGKERVSQVFNYYDGEIVDRTDYIYEKGKLVSTFSFDTSDIGGGNSVRRRKLTDLDGSGKIDAEDAILASNGEFTETSFTGRAGKERASQAFTWYEGEIVDRRDFMYANGRLISDALYDTEGMSREEARLRGSGIEDEVRTYVGRKGRERLSWSSTYGDISVGEIALVDPLYKDDTVFKAMIDGLVAQGRAVIEDSDGDGKVDRIIIYKTTDPGDGKERTYNYTYENAALHDVTETIGAETTERVTYYYSGNTGEEHLDLTSNSRFQSQYHYTAGALDCVTQYRYNGQSGAYDILSTEIIYTGTKGNERIQTITKYKADGVTVKTHSTYQYDLDVGKGGDGAGCTDTLDKVTEYYGATTNVKEEYFYYEGVDGAHSQRAKYEQIQKVVSHKSDGTIKSVSGYEYDLTSGAGGDGVPRSLDKVTTYYNAETSWDGIIFDAGGNLTADTYKKYESLYEGRESKEKIKTMYTLANRFVAGVQVVTGRTEYKYDVLPADGSAIDDGLDLVTVYKLAEGDDCESGGTLKSQTYYLGYEGQEVSDYTYNYKGARDSEMVSTTVVYYYESNCHRANALLEYDAMAVSRTFKTASIDTINMEPLSETNTPNLVSETFYTGGKADEIADYSYNYKVGTMTVKNVSVYYYDSARASIGTDPEAAMNKSETYKTTAIGLISSAATDANILSETHYKGEKGEEVADFSYNFKFGTDTKKTTSIYFYEAGQLRADAATVTSDSAMTRSDTYKTGDVSIAVRGAETGNNLVSETFYKGGKGDEIADYSYNYKLGTMTVKNVSVYYYNSARAAIDTDPETPMNMSETYKTDDILKISKTAASANILSETYYKGEKGEEVADYSYNFKFGTDTKKTTSIYFYEAGQLRADAATVTSDSAMTRSDTYKTGDVLAAVRGAETGNNLVSETFYKGGKGDEIAD
ncbi:MAG: hypothetical protein V1927_02775, partial [Candidatus Omnitrophota bacterium]